MLGKAITILSLILLPFANAAPQVIENPDKPQSKTAGRVIELKEVLKITDEGGEFFFKYPRSPKIGRDGSIFVQDNEQVLQFDKQGKFIRNYFKKGQGPGEMSYALAAIPDAQGLCIQASGPGKLVWFDELGKLLKERPVRPSGRMSLFLQAFFGDTYYFSGSEFPRLTGEAQYFENPYSIVAMKDGSEELKSLQSFPVKQFVVTSGGGGGMISIGPFLAVPYQSRYLIVIHTCEYLIKLLDSRSNTVVRTFNRKYARVESPPIKPENNKPMMMINGKTYSRPPQKYLNDISAVYIVKNAIWIVTSTKDSKKRVLIDVFNAEGAYTDSFYLSVPADGQFVITDEYCLTVEKNPDETYAIKKYEFVWKN
jgi:hypothetical protein